MFVDASAIVAMMTDERHAAELAARLGRAATRLTSAVAVFEATAAVARVLALPVPTAGEAVSEFLGLMAIEVVPLPAEIAPLAVDAFARFGKGQRHPAQLNMGDCVAYACARFYEQPLLFKGADFSQTDVEPA
jgi:ribonuclease VapC